MRADPFRKPLDSVEPDPQEVEETEGYDAVGRDPSQFVDSAQLLFELRDAEIHPAELRHLPGVHDSVQKEDGKEPEQPRRHDLSAVPTPLTVDLRWRNRMSTANAQTIF